MLNKIPDLYQQQVLVYSVIKQRHMWKKFQFVISDAFDQFETTKSNCLPSLVSYSFWEMEIV